MQKKLFAILFFLAASFASAQTNEKQVDSKIKDVTVFLKGAQLTREVNTQLTIGKAVLKLSGLSPDIDAKSIRIKGGDNYKIISVNHHKNYIEQLTNSDEIAKLSRKIEEIDLVIASIENEIAILKEKEQFLKSNTNITGTDKVISPADYKELTEFYSKQIMEVRNQVFSKSLIIKQKKAQLAKLNAQNKELTKSEKVHSSEILINLLMLRPGNANLELSYYVENARWYPSYDVRVDKVGEPLQLTYKANIEQNTGINWKNVNVNLSNAKHDNENTFKGLETSYVKFYTPNISEALKGQVSGLQISKATGSPGTNSHIVVRGTSSVSGNNKPLYLVDGVPINDPSNLPHDIIESISIQKSASATALYGTRAANGLILITTKKGGFIDNNIVEEINIAYKLEVPVTIFSDKPVSTFDIQSVKVEAEYMYKCAPLLSKNVYTVAKVANWENLKLLNGETNLFYQQTYIGTSYLNTKLTSDTLDFNLGKDNDIVVKRKSLPDFGKNQFVGNKRVVNNGYEIEIRNNKNKAIKLELFDQIPLTNDKQITVEVEETTSANYNDKTGILKWKLELIPKKTKKLMVKYVVKYPKGQVVTVN